jgi:phosphate:Na+ symporter
MVVVGVMFFALFGGIGLFLLGMILLTEGLKAFAGDSLRHALLRFTGRPLSAFCSGAAVTALVQSSSATTLATIGFVSAGLLGFSQAVGIVFGASLGTTSTGWIVSTIGLKFSIGSLALPLTGLGAFMRLLGRGKISSLGLALAGFGLIFIGIDTLQEGMGAIAESFDLSRIPYSGIAGHLLLMLIGLLMTVVMQSSSAAVATTLAALHTEAIIFEQAASLVIGQAIGTTVTAALAAIGATIAAKRTALAHIVFNVATGVLALFLLPFYLPMVNQFFVAEGELPGAVALAAFHTLFIATGVLIFLPLAKPFAQLIERILPERESRLTRFLDRSLLEIPAVAQEAAARTLMEVISVIVDSLRSVIPGSKSLGEAVPRLEINEIGEIRSFISALPSDDPLHSNAVAQRVDLMHALDHVGQIIEQQLPLHTGFVEKDKNLHLELFYNLLQKTIGHIDFLLVNNDWQMVEQIAEDAALLADTRRNSRHVLLESASLGHVDSSAVLDLLDHIRALDSTVYHLWRALEHLHSLLAKQGD